MSGNTAMNKDRPDDVPGWLVAPIELEEQRGFRASRNTMRLVVGLTAGALFGPG